MTLPYTLVKNVLTKERCSELDLEFTAKADSEFDPRPGYSHHGLPIQALRSAKMTEYSDIKDAITLAYNHFLDTYTMRYNTFELKRAFGNVMDVGAENEAHDDDGDVYPDKPEYEEHYSCILMLNSDYEGGELFFQHHGIEIKLEAGDLIMFRGNAANLHGVRPITSGHRTNVIIFFKNYHREFPMELETTLYPW